MMCLRYPGGEVISHLELRSSGQASDSRWELSACNKYPQLQEWLTSLGSERKGEGRSPRTGPWALNAKKDRSMGMGRGSHRAGKRSRQVVRGVLRATGGMIQGQEELCKSNAAGGAPRTRTQT